MPFLEKQDGVELETKLFFKDKIEIQHM